MSHSVAWSEHALRQAERLDRRTRERLDSALERFAMTGYGDVRPLQARTRQWRLRVGDWRVIFTYEDETSTIVIVAVLPRDRAYR